MNFSTKIVTPRSYQTDAAFDNLYPVKIQRLSKRHWTPLSIAKASARFLSDGRGKKILDIGSGAGKFCLIGAHYCPDAYFFGVEQRQELFQCAQHVKTLARLKNVFFISGNFTQLDLNDYDHFYFYNAFFENLDETDRIDDQIAYSKSLYVYYCRYLFNALEQKPGGTRLVTFHGLGDEVPPSYQLVDVSGDLLFKCWIKK